jgi:phage tail sheath protein FI
VPILDEQPKPLEPPPPDWSHFRDCLVPPPPQDVPKKLCLQQSFSFKPPDDTGEIPDVRQQLALLPVLKPVNAYQVDQLLAVQKAVVTLCAARADVVAILSLPQHFTRREVLDWQKALQAKLLGDTVNADDLNMLSYVAVYHPWLQLPETVTPELAPLRATPPDGASCGMIAARELSRGPWIAPANVPLRGVVALTPVFTRDDWVALFDARINLVRQLPGQFTLMSAHTLSYDDQFVHISVRRLLIFIRKLALQRGMRYVFESNTERFRQRVQASFESTLHTLVARGGIVAFEVVTDESINTQNDFDNGRFLIAIKVAPTLPIEFITVILLRSGEDVLNVIER